MSTFTAADGTSLTPDLVVSEDYIRDIRVTDHPVEDGSTTSDNALALPARIIVTGAITETPLTSDLNEVDGVQRVIDALAFLDGAVGQLLSYQSDRLGLFDNMMIEGFPHNIDKSRSCTFTVSLKQIRIAQFASVDIPPEAPQPAAEAGAPDEVDIGEQPTKTPSDGAAEDDTSWLRDGLDWLAG